MLQERLEHINLLRKAALSDEVFQQLSQEHRQAIEAEIKAESTLTVQKRKKKTKPKLFSQRYQDSDFNVNPSGTTH
ncbi:hypothetical protein [Aliivibrio fischeri]|uniref:hypothetical protein n=1 Tax=Aliivibrio fischeri TaxID=668 RepID=UPI0007C47E71|nr:hypothetical protein [Aliivibrio fischeri]